MFTQATQNVGTWLWFEYKSMCIDVDYFWGVYIHPSIVHETCLWLDLSFRHLSCLRSWPNVTESGCWLNCEGERRAGVFLLRFRSWKSLMNLTKIQKKRAVRRCRRKARLTIQQMFPLRRRPALCLRGAAAAFQTRHLQRAKFQISE